MSFCSHCGQQVPDTASFCPGCGRPLNYEQPSNHCSACGTVFSGKPSYCPACGRRTNYASPNGYPCNSRGKEVRSECSTALAFFLSFIIPGLGVVYAGDTSKGFGILIASVVVSILAFVSIFLGLATLALWIYGIYDACTLSEENRRLWHSYQDSNFGPHP